MVFVALALAAGVSQEHALGLELAHSHGQEAWPLVDGDAALIRQVLGMLPSRWTWEDTAQTSEWTFGGLRSMDVETHDTLVFHMLHHHGLAPLLASHAEDWDDFLAAFEPEERDRADFAAAARTRDAKKLAVAEKRFPRVDALAQVLGQLSLSGLRNLHSYDHQAEWRCKGPFGRLDGALQAMADARTVTWLRATHTPAVRDAVRAEYYELRSDVAQLDSLKDGRGRHVETEFLQLSQSQWGAFAPVHTWAVDTLHFSLSRREQDGVRRCFAEGRIEWEGFDDTSRFSVPLTDAECTAVEADGAQTDRVSEHVREWIQGAVARQRAALGAKRGLVWAQEEADFARHDVVAETPQTASTCAGYRPTQAEIVQYAHEMGEYGLLFQLQTGGPHALRVLQDRFEHGASLLEGGSLLEAGSRAATHGIIRRVEKQ